MPVCQCNEEEKGTLESDKQDVPLYIDPADFVWNSVAHFARSLILYISNVKNKHQAE